MRSNRVVKASAAFSEGFNCAQAVFSAFAPSHGIAEQEALKIASGFGGGMARLQEVCGAVTGAFMAIGAANGDETPADHAARKKTYEDVRTFDRRFRDIHGSILCRDLIGADMNTEEGRRIIKEKDLFNTVCARCVRDAAEIVEELISKR
jgi:C_GCAxxG_C_C family probable redox protein